jgi:hypothetical protein
MTDSTLNPSDAINTITQAARDGAADAREMANRVWASTSLFVSRFVYTTSYTLSYGIVFPATLIARSVPKNNAAVRGIIDGALAATQRAHELKSGELHIPPALTIH